MHNKLHFPIAVTLIAICCLHTSVMGQDPQVKRSPIFVELKLSAEEFDPSNPDGSLICIAHNISDFNVTVPVGYNSDVTRVYGQGRTLKPTHEPTTRWPLKLYLRQGPNRDLKKVSLRPGGQIKLFELSLPEIIAERKTTLVLKNDGPVPPQQLRSNEEFPKQLWGWDWIAHPRPPATPIHTQDGYAAVVEFWAEVAIGRDIITSNRHQILVSKPTEFQMLIWETSGGGDVKFSIVAENSDYIIHLFRHSFSKQNRKFRLTADDGAPYKIVQEILANKRPIPNDPTMAKRATGSWTTISLVDIEGNKKEIKHAMPWEEDLNQISSFVDAAVKQ